MDDQMLRDGFIPVRKKGSTQFVRIESLAGERCRIKTDMGWPLQVQSLEQSLNSWGKRSTLP